jgi:hypothetical protein
LTKGLKKDLKRGGSRHWYGRERYRTFWRDRFGAGRFGAGRFGATVLAQDDLAHAVLAQDGLAQEMFRMAYTLENDVERQFY